MTGVIPTHIPDARKLPYEALPAPPLARTVTNVPYGIWCKDHNVTAASLFHTVNALTITSLLEWLPESEGQDGTRNMTYYRLSSNRGSTLDVAEMGGTPISISPMRIALSASSDAATIAWNALKHWLDMQSSDPY
jgi:hypothetical protein